MKYLVTVVEQSRTTEMVEAESETDAVAKVNDAYEFTPIATHSTKTRHIEVKPAGQPHVEVVDDGADVEIVTLN